VSESGLEPQNHADDPTVLGTVAALVAGVTLWASWFPAHRAAGVDPTRAVQGVEKSL
jgi:ABC-type lipoprotein release transport system permease subunit